MKEPTQTNAADGFTKALQTAKYLEWRNRLGKGYDNGDEAETSKREALAKPGRWARVETIHAIPHPVLIAMLQPCETEAGNTALGGDRLGRATGATVVDGLGLLETSTVSRARVRAKSAMITL